MLPGQRAVRPALASCPVHQGDIRARPSQDDNRRYGAADRDDLDTGAAP